MKKILFVSNDVMFWARVLSAAKTAGSDALRIADEASMEAAYRDGGASRVIVDLGFRALDLKAWAARWKASPFPPQLVAFGSHVDAQALEAARIAEFDVVMANSQFHRSLADWVA